MTRYRKAGRMFLVGWRSVVSGFQRVEEKQREKEKKKKEEKNSGPAVKRESEVRVGKNGSVRSPVLYTYRNLPLVTLHSSLV